MSAAGDVMLGTIVAANARAIAEASTGPVVLDDRSRARGLASLRKSDSPLSLAWLEGVLAKAPRGLDADEKKKILDRAEDLDGEAKAVVVELVEAHAAKARAAIEAEYAARRAAEAAEYKREVEERAAAWRALPRRSRELILLEERFSAQDGSALDLVRAIRLVEALTDEEIDTLIPDTWRSLARGLYAQPAKPRGDRF